VSGNIAGGPSRSRLFLLFPFVALFVLGLTVSSAWAVEEHAFDPVLSLRGDCTTGALDTVPDPGPCPGAPSITHPSKHLNVPCGVTVDSHGYIYVANPEVGGGEGTEGVIDVFNAQGEYLAMIADEHQPCDLAVDSQGNLYVNEVHPHAVSVYEPDSYPPKAGATYTRSVLHESGEFCGLEPTGIAVDPSSDHLLISWPCRVVEYDSVSNGSTPISGREEIGANLGEAFGGVGVCGANHDVIVIGTPFGLTSSERAEAKNSRVFSFDGADGHKKLEIDGREAPDETPEGGFGFNRGSAAIGVDQANCDFYVGDITARGTVYQFGSNGRFIAKLRHSLSDAGRPYFADLAVDDPYPGQVGYDSPNEGEVYVAQGENASTSHLYAFRPGSVGPPELKAEKTSGITETEAVLEAELNPGGLDTRYRFEYITEADYQADGEQFGAGLTSVPQPEADAGSETFFVSAAAPVAGLEPDATYRFRLVASNCSDPEAIPGECETSGEAATFTTYPAAAGLLDGRGYELVTPADTNGLIPTMAPLGENATLRGNFDTLLASPDGRSVFFGTEGGSLPTLIGGGFHDVYESVRGEGGWKTRFVGINGTQAERPDAGGASPDHGYSFWVVDEEGRGSLPMGNYLRFTDGSLEPIGVGKLGVDLTAGGDWISSNDHVIFHTGRTLGAKTIKLEEKAPETGTPAIYDRAPGGPTQVVSLLPGDNTPKPGDASFFQGASSGGTVVAFKTLTTAGETEAEAPLFARLDNTRTVEVASEPTVFGGVSRNGTHIVYLKPNPSEPRRPNPVLPAADNFPQGDIFSYDVATEAATPIGSGEESLLVNVSPDGSRVYFDSPEVLDEAEEGVAGKENLYVWNAGGDSIHLVATLVAADVFGQPTPHVTSQTTDGLGLWASDVVEAAGKNPNVGPGADPSRASDDGSVLIFESRAKLTGYENGGHAEIYRYDETAPAGRQVDCLSCNPTGQAPQSDAMLQTLPAGLLEVLPPVNSLAAVPNLTPNGRRAFFETGDPLVAGDIDGKIDIYEWEAQGMGTCVRPGGCVSLISSGRSVHDNYLYAVSADGSDVFFLTGDLLVSEDHDATPSIYDARIGGGATEQGASPTQCLGEACQSATAAPGTTAPASESFEGPPNPGRGCTHAARARRRGRARCARHHRHHHRHRRAGFGGRSAR
jgi:hypothetical protein